MPQPEEHACQTIDCLFAMAGWYDCDPGNDRVSVQQGVSIKGSSITSRHGCVDSPPATRAAVALTGRLIGTKGLTETDTRLRKDDGYKGSLIQMIFVTKERIP